MNNNTNKTTIDAQFLVSVDCSLVEFYFVTTHPLVNFLDIFSTFLLDFLQTKTVFAYCTVTECMKKASSSQNS